MKKTMWKWKAVLTLMVCMAAVGGNGSGCKVQAETEGDFEYYDTEDGDGVVITGRTGKGGDVTIEGDVTIPETIGGKKVTSIGDGAFSGSGLTSITIPDSVESIGEYAFSGSELKSIKIPDSVESIGQFAFSDCPNLEEITVEEGNSVYTSPMVMVDGEQKSCNAILAEEGTILVYGCKTTIIPDGVTSIGDGAFSGSGLKSIKIPDSVTSIGRFAFNICSELTSIIISDSVESIGVSAFEHCSELESIKIPDSVESIEEYAFCGCSELESITIPDSVESIGEYAFSNCPNLEEITVEEGNSVYTSPMVKVDGEQKPCNAILTEEGTILVCGCKTTIIPDNVKSIGNGVFEGCSELESITIPDGVESIGEFAFEDCSGLTSITIPDSVKSIGDCAFNSCSGLTSITISDSVTSIGKSVFHWCSENMVIHTPSGSTAEKYAKENNIKVDNNMSPTPTTPGGAAQDTKPDTTPTTEAPAQTNVPAAKKTSLTAEKEKAKVKVTSDNAANPTVEYVASTNKSAKTVKVPDTVTVGGVTYKVTSVKDKAFKGNKKLTSVTIGKNVTSIGKDAFKSCAKLKTVTVKSDKLAKIGAGAFNGDKKLTKVTLGKGVTSIGKEAFKNCTSLKSVTVKSTKLKTIGANAFYGDKKLATITLKTTKLTKKSVGKNALKGTNKKLKIKVPKKQVKSYKKYFKGKGNKSVKLTK